MGAMQKLLPYLFFIMFLCIKYEVLCKKCSLENPKDQSKSLLLENISLLTGVKYVANRDNFSYAVSLCSDVSGNHPNASVTRTLIDKKTTTVLGRYNETDIVDVGNHQILLTFSGGDSLHESAFCNNTKWKTLILISCNYNADDINIDLLDPLNGGCFALFHLKTSVYCPPRHSIFLTILFVTVAVFCAYFLSGIIYKRYTEGAKGWEQIPHYEFWKSPLQNLMGCLKNKNDSQRFQSRVNDPEDESLLHP